MSTMISTCVSHPLRLHLRNKLLPPLLPLLSLHVLLVMCPITPIWALVIPPTMDADEAETDGVAIVLTDAALVVVAGVSHQWSSHQSSPSSGLQPLQVYPPALVILLALLLLILQFRPLVILQRFALTCPPFPTCLPTLFFTRAHCP